MSRPTMEDVAARAGVSRALVSLVMRNSPKVSDKSRAKVLAAAEDLGYRPNLMARNLASQRTRTVGLLLNDLHNPYFAELADGVIEAADEAGYRVVINTGLRDPAVERTALETFIEFRCDGVIACGPRLDVDGLNTIAKEIPLVGAALPVTSEHYDTVSNDEGHGTALAIDHLVDLGHTDIVHIDGGNGSGSALRREGYRSAMARHNLTPDVVEGNFTERSGVAAVGEILKRPTMPTAIFTANDLTAAGALDRLDSEGLRVPTDISLIGYDNVSLSALGHIALTTINQPRRAIGGLALRTLLQRLDGTRTTSVDYVLPPDLVVRSTTGPNPGD